MYDGAMQDFDMYQELAGTTAIYPGRGESLIFPALGLAGEAGEVAGKTKHLIRVANDLYAQPDDAFREALKKELGDILWYVAAVCHEAGLSMADVASANLAKLASRKERGVIYGEGDDR